MSTTDSGSATRSISHRTVWAIADQSVISGGNFATNLILARTLPPVQFGIYALLLNTLLFLNNVHAALITTPVCITGARSDIKVLGRTVSAGITGTLLLSAGSMLVIVAACAILKHSTLILPVFLALLFWQLQETLRSGFIARMQQNRAIWGDALSYCGQAILLVTLCAYLEPAISTIFIIIAATSLLAAGVQYTQIRPGLLSRSMLRSNLGEIWLLGRWNVLAKLLGFLTAQAFPWIILLRHGALQVAGFQAIFQLLAVTNPITFSIGSLITASIAGSRKTESGKKAIASAKPIHPTDCGHYRHIPHRPCLRGASYPTILLWPQIALRHICPADRDLRHRMGA